MNDAPPFSEDLGLIRRAQQGDDTAIDSLGNRLRCVPVFVAKRNAMRGNPLHSDDQEDLVQDIVAQVWRKIGLFKGEAPFEGWVYQFCLLEMKSFMRRKFQRDSRSEQLESLDQGRGALPDSNPDRYEDLYSGLDEIDSEQSQIIQLKHFNQLTFDEISHRIGVSANTVKTRYYRGLIKLRAHLDPIRQEEGS